MQFKTGLIIGRFQPFHRGHLYLIKQALKHVEKLIIGNNFLGKSIIEVVHDHEVDAVLSDKKIVPIDDYPNDDDFWLKELKKKTGPFNILFGNNEWVNGILKARGIKVKRFPLYKRDIYEGKKIREEMKNSKNPKTILKKHQP